jgi:hypothetical protein
MSIFGFRRSVPAISRRQAAVGTNWVHERNHDGFGLMARGSPVGIRLRLTQRGKVQPLPADRRSREIQAVIRRRNLRARLETAAKKRASMPAVTIRSRISQSMLNPSVNAATAP